MINVQSKLLLPLSLGVLVVLGFMYIQNTWIITMNGTYNHVLNIAGTVDVNFPKKVIIKQDISLKDVEKQPYQQIKNILIKLENKDSDIHFVYIYTRKEVEIYCVIADSEDS